MANEADLLESPVETPEPAPSLRETVEAAFEESEAKSPDAVTPPESAAPVPSPDQAKPAVTPKPPATAEGTPAAKPVKPGKPEELKAPSQWKPEVRQHWNKLPRAVQEEVIRREGDSMRLIGSVGPKIRIADEVMNHMAPFAERLNENGITPNAFAAEVFSTVKQLAGGNPQQRAEIIANIVQSYGVDLRLLDQVLTQRISAPPEVLQARAATARANAIVAQQQMGIEQQTAQQAEQAVNEFGADPQHEFLDDVRDLMADLIEAGRVHNLDDAYAAAVWAHPDTRKILLQREAQQRAVAKGQRAVAARRASSSVSGTPTFPGGNTAQGGHSLRDTLEAAFDEHTPL